MPSFPHNEMYLAELIEQKRGCCLQKAPDVRVNID